MVCVAVVLQAILTVVLFSVLEDINLLLSKACAKFQMYSISNFFCLLLMQVVLLVFFVFGKFLRNQLLSTVHTIVDNSSFPHKT